MIEQTGVRFPAVDGPEATVVQYLPAWLARTQADALLPVLLAQVPWEIHRIRMFGRWLDSPRISCWMGDADAHYRYSGADFVPHAWMPSVMALREQLQQACAGSFNSVLLNRYRDGRDSMGWHSDDEPELGPTPLIASLSLGASRRFLLRRRDDPAQKQEYLLGHGDLLLMRGHCQRDYQHALPKTARVSGERINLTFRQIAAVPRRVGR